MSYLIQLLIAVLFLAACALPFYALKLLHQAPAGDLHAHRRALLCTVVGTWAWSLAAAAAYVAGWVEIWVFLVPAAWGSIVGGKAAWGAAEGWRRGVRVSEALLGACILPVLLAIGTPMFRYRLDGGKAYARLQDLVPALKGNSRGAAVPVTASRDLVAVVVSQWDDAEVRHEAMGILGRMGPDAAGASADLVQLLAKPEEELRRFAIQTLSSIGAPAAPVLAASLLDPEPRIRRGTAAALAGIVEVPEAVVVPLAQAMQDPDWEIRAAAATAIGKARPSAAAGADALFGAAADPDTRVRQAALGALSAPGIPPGERMAGLLTAGLKDGDPAVRDAAALAIHRLGERSGVAAPDLLKALDDPSHNVKSAACTVVGKLRPVHPQVIPALREALRTPNRRYAKSAVFDLGPQGVPLIDELLIDANSPDKNDRIGLCNLLENMGPAALISAPVLMALMDDPDPVVRLRAQAALKAVQPAPR